MYWYNKNSEYQETDSTNIITTTLDKKSQEQNYEVKEIRNIFLKKQ